MSTETVLTDEQISRMRYKEFVVWREEDHEAIERFARAIEQAVLQSPEIQELRKDAERWNALASHIHEIDVTFHQGKGNHVRRLRIDIRATAPSPTIWLARETDSFIAHLTAMEKQT